MTPKTGLDRRTFLKATIVDGGAVVFGFNLPLGTRAAERLGIEIDPAADFQPNAFIRIAKDGKVTVVVSQVEMGQGVYTSLPMIVADELEVEWANVSYEAAPPDKAFINPAMGMQGTGGSSSVKGFFLPLRKSAAAVREMLIAAAAQGWNVTPESCKAEAGKVVHAESKRSAAYGELLEAAAKMAPPKEPKLKDPKDFKYIGKAVRRLDSPDKVNGKAVFGIDVRVPGMLYATILRSPVIGGKVKTVDDTAAKAVKGVTNIVPLGYGVGVIADNFVNARKGRNALKVTWDDGAMATVSSESIMKSFADGADNKKGLVPKKTGDLLEAGRLLSRCAEPRRDHDVVSRPARAALLGSTSDRSASDRKRDPVVVRGALVADEDGPVEEIASRGSLDLANAHVKARVGRSSEHSAGEDDERDCEETSDPFHATPGPPPRRGASRGRRMPEVYDVVSKGSIDFPQAQWPVAEADPYSGPTASPTPHRLVEARDRSGAQGFPCRLPSGVDGGMFSHAGGPLPTGAPVRE